MQTEANVANNIRPGLDYYLGKGYLPIDGTYGCCNFYGPVSTQEEYNAADNSIAQMAQAMGKSAIASTFAARANNWQNVFNPGSGFLQPKLANGAFQSGFDPPPATDSSRPTPTSTRRSCRSTSPAWRVPREATPTGSSSSMA